MPPTMNDHGRTDRDQRDDADLQSQIIEIADTEKAIGRGENE